MKIYVRSNTELEFFLKDSIEIDIDIYPDDEVEAAKEHKYKFDHFPDVDNFRKELSELLSKKYRFKIMTEDIDGHMQKGWISNRNNSISVYFNTIYDLMNGKQIAKESGINFDKIRESANVLCFIHIRISDHIHPDEGYSDHRKFMHDNIETHVSNKDNYAMIIKQEDITIHNNQGEYSDMLQSIEYDIQDRIKGWIRRYNAMQGV